MKFYFKEHAVSCIFSAIKSPGGVMLVTQETPTKIRFYAEQIVKIFPIFYSTGCCFLNIYKFIESVFRIRFRKRFPNFFALIRIQLSL